MESFEGKAELSAKAGAIDDRGQLDLVSYDQSEQTLNLNLNDQVVEITA